MSGRRTILVVDDNRAIRDFCRQVLEEAGFAILEAEDGIDAREVFAAHSEIALVIVDVLMPKMSGPSLVQELLSRHPALKVLYISGHIAENRLLQRHIVESGCSFLQKPFMPTDLVARVRKLLDVS